MEDRGGRIYDNGRVVPAFCLCRASSGPLDLQSNSPVVVKPIGRIRLSFIKIADSKISESPVISSTEFKSVGTGAQDAAIDHDVFTRCIRIFRFKTKCIIR